MNNQKKDTDKSANNKGDDSVLEKVARTIAPPSREVSDAELIDPGANSPAPSPKRPTNSPMPDSNASGRPPEKNIDHKR